MRSKLRPIAAWFLIVIGLILGPFPIVPGWPLVAAGVALLGPNHRFVKRIRDWLVKRGIMKPPGADKQTASEEQVTR